LRCTYKGGPNRSEQTSFLPQDSGDCLLGYSCPVSDSGFLRVSQVSSGVTGRAEAWQATAAEHASRAGN